MKLIEASTKGCTLYEMPEFTYCLLMRSYFNWPRLSSGGSRIQRMITLLPSEQQKRITITENYDPGTQLQAGQIMLDEGGRAVH